MTKKWWIIFIILLVSGVSLGKILGGEAGRDTAVQDRKEELREKIKSSCMNYEGATDQACECHAKRVVNEITPQELNKFGEDEAITEKVATIAIECILETKE